MKFDPASEVQAFDFVFEFCHVGVGPASVDIKCETFGQKLNRVDEKVQPFLGMNSA
ncbi:hypothetical protein STA1M1_31000 [Sinisalibacter aestuarii]|uniref:Uncharacterized protein n=1 Tax=Sinisalibacter aestuarii TaxID=2949426 RepID=A0ABQ5LY93_9RHOB|nr:hypothetical protein STA1M1_31000 [Sinisalibacter aestuarii]